MKKMFGIVIVLLFLYALFQTIYGLLIREHVIIYSLKVGEDYYNVKEAYNSGHKTEGKEKPDFNNYYYEISKKGTDDVLFSFKLVGDYGGKKEFLNDLKLYEDDNVTCAYPIFKDHQNQLDVICRQGSTQFNYTNIKGSYANLDAFVASLVSSKYSYYSWVNNQPISVKLDNITIYTSNIVDKMYVAVWNYGGIYKIDAEKQLNLRLLKQDQYDNFLCTMVNQYYVIPDYSQDNNFSRLVMMDLTTTKAINVELPSSISFDSFIQGVVDDYIYIIDKSNKKQYKFNIYEKDLIVVGDKSNKGRYYHNGVWEERSIFDIIDNKLVFKDEVKVPVELEQYGATKIDEVMGETDGYYYLYKTEGKRTKVYRVDKQNLNIATLLFSSTKISNVSYIDDIIYFTNGDTLYMYKDRYGLRPLVKNNEFTFNSSNMYKIYFEK